MKLQRQDLQFPFSPRDLLSARSFISYCRDHRVDISIAELESYDQDNKLLPSLAVNRDLIDYREIYGDFSKSGNKYWTLVSTNVLGEYKYEDIKEDIFFGFEECLIKNKAWLDNALKANKAFYPSQKEFTVWDLSPVKFTPTPKDLGSNKEYFYSKLQMYLVYYIMTGKGVGRANVIKTPGGFVKINQITGDRNNEKTRLEAFFRTFKFLNQLNNMWIIRQSGLKRTINDKIKYFEDGERLTLVGKAYLEQEVDDKLKIYAKDLLNKYEFSISELEEWRLFFLGFGTFGLGSKVMGSKKKYIGVLKEEILSGTEDPYKLVHLLNWYIALVGGRNVSIRDLLLRDENYEICPHCGTNYISRQRNQETCGEKDCVNAQKRLNRQLARHTIGKLTENS